MISDEEIMARVRECSDWGEPWDNWGHVISQIRKGRIYFQRKGKMTFKTKPGQLSKCGFLKEKQSQLTNR